MPTEEYMCLVKIVLSTRILLFASTVRLIMTVLHGEYICCHNQLSYGDFCMTSAKEYQQRSQYNYLYGRAIPVASSIWKKNVLRKQNKNAIFINS